MKSKLLKSTKKCFRYTSDLVTTLIHYTVQYTDYGYSTQQFDSECLTLTYLLTWILGRLVLYSDGKDSQFILKGCHCGCRDDIFWELVPGNNYL